MRKFMLVERARYYGANATSATPSVFLAEVIIPLAPRRVEFATRLRGLLYRRKSGPVARRAFRLSWLRGQLWHLIAPGLIFPLAFS
jgi:hypothetical protein